MKQINFKIEEETYDKFRDYVKTRRDTMTRLLINYIEELVNDISTNKI